MKHNHTFPQHEMSDRDALRMLKAMAQRFSGESYAFDDLDAAIDRLAHQMAEAEGFRGEEIGVRYLSAPTKFGPSFEKDLNLSGAQFYGSRFGG